MIAPEILWPVMTAVVGIGLAVGGLMYVTRDKTKDAKTERATKRLYETPTRDDLEK